MKSTRNTLPLDHASWIAERLGTNRALFGDATMTGPTGDPTGQTGETGQNGGGAPKDDGKPPAEKTLTQTEVNAIAAREKAEGKRQAEQQLATDLGVDLATAKEIIRKSRETEEAKKDEATKAREAADAEKTAAEAEKNAAKAEIYETRLERAFARAGLELGDSDTDKAKAARIRRMVSTEPGASYEDVLSDVQAIKTDFPELFGAKAEEKPPRRTPGSDPKSKAPAPKGGEDAFARGQARARGHRSQYQAKVENPAGTG